MRCKRGRWQAAAATAALLAGAMAAAGCSLALSGPGPRVAGRPRQGVLECDTGKGLVAFDGIIATAFGVGSLGLLSSEVPGSAALPAIVAFGFFASALRGNAAVNDCRQAHEELQLQLVEASAPGQRPARRKKKAATALAAPGAPPSATAPITPVAPGVPTRSRPGAPPSATPPRPATSAPRAAVPRPVPAPPAATPPRSAPPPPLAAAPPPASAPPPSRPATAPPPPTPPPSARSEEPWDDFWTEVP